MTHKRGQKRATNPASWPLSSPFAVRVVKKGEFSRPVIKEKWKTDWMRVWCVPEKQFLLRVNLSHTNKGAGECLATEKSEELTVMDSLACTMLTAVNEPKRFLFPPAWPPRFASRANFSSVFATKRHTQSFAKNFFSTPRSARAIRKSYLLLWRNFVSPSKNLHSIWAHKGNNLRCCDEGTIWPH